MALSSVPLSSWLARTTVYSNGPIAVIFGVTRIVAPGRIAATRAARMISPTMADVSAVRLAARAERSAGRRDLAHGPGIGGGTTGTGWVSSVRGCHASDVGAAGAATRAPLLEPTGPAMAGGAIRSPRTTWIEALAGTGAGSRGSASRPD